MKLTFPRPFPRVLPARLARRLGKRGIVTTLAVLVLAGVTAAVAAGVTVRDAGAKANDPPAEKLPAASEFRTGTCRSAAEEVLAVATLAARHRGAKKIPADGRKALTDRQSDLAELQKTADADVAKPLTDLVTSIGFVRLHSASKSYNPRVLAQMDAARKTLQRTCVP